jgi:MYXO-CTERM domain-containing protein
MCRTAALALAGALAAAALPARAQFQPRPMRVPKAYGATVEVAPLVSSPSSDVLTAVVPGEAARNALFRARSFPASEPIPYAALGSAQAFTAGPLGDGGAADLVWVDGFANEIGIAFGAAPGTLRTYPLAGRPDAPTLARLLSRPADVLALPVDTRALVGDPSRYELVGADFDAAGDLLPVVSWPAPAGLVANTWVRPRLVPVRISPTARSLGVDDLVLPMQDVAVVLWNRGGSSLAPALMEAVALGDPANPAAHLPASVTPPVWILGAAALDVDGDGLADLVFAAVPKDGGGPGRLLWARNGGSPASLAAPWQELVPGPAAGAIADPWLVRPLELGGAPAAAVWDRATEEIVVLTSGGAGAGLRAVRLPVPGVFVEDVFEADVVGTAAPDLVVACHDLATGLAQWILVFPDDGDPAPTIAWAPGSPAPATRGTDLPLAVEAADDGPFRVEWVLGAADAPPMGTGPSFVLPGADLCDPASPPTVLARAVDALGVYAEISASVDLATGGPSLRVAGAVPPGRIVLAPGGTPVDLEAEAWTGCGGPVAFAWSSSGIAPLQDGGVSSGATWSRWAVVLPEAAYPALLGGAGAVGVAATEGPYSGAATLALAPDGSGLVAADLGSDRATLAPGEEAVLTAVLRSRIGVPIPSARVVFALAGLEPAGPPAVRGASALEVGAGGADLVLDALPPADAEVAIDLPVRSNGGAAASAVEVRSAAGVPLSARAEASPAGAPAPGCASGGGDPAAVALLGAALAAARRRRRLT